MLRHAYNMLPAALSLAVFIIPGWGITNTSVARAQTCELAWDVTIGDRGTNGPILALEVLDDGTGSAMYAGGLFDDAGGVGVNNIAKWTGTSWASLGGGLTFPGQPAWIGSLLASDRLGVPTLYAGGYFLYAGAAAAPQIAQWDGLEWAGVGGGCNNPVTALTMFDDGFGTALYAGGRFTIAGGVSTAYIAKWNGAQWSALGSGMSAIAYPWVRALTVFDDGNGSALYAGGGFESAGKVDARFVARWDGSQWSQVGGGLSGTTGITSSGVHALAVFDDGGGEALYAAGIFEDSEGDEDNRVAMWDGVEWSMIGGNFDGIVRSLAVFNDGSGNGPALYAGGDFVNAGGVEVNYVARWNGASWSAMGSGLGGGLQNFWTGAYALHPWQADSTSTLYAGGVFTIAGGSATDFAAGWQGCLSDCNSNGIADGDEFGDYDGNGDVDLRDVARLQLCFDPQGPVVSGTCCPIFDLGPDPDDDVDLDDYVEFDAVLTGPR